MFVRLETVWGIRITGVEAEVGSRRRPGRTYSLPSSRCPFGFLGGHFATQRDESINSDW